MTDEKIIGEEKVEIQEESIESMDDFQNEIDNSFSRINIGDIVEGTIISVTDTELLVNIAYISDAIVPVENTLADKEQSLKELYQVGDVINGEVLKINDGEGNVLLSIKKAEQVLIWDELEESFKNGSTIKVKVDAVVKGGLVCNIKSIRAFIPASHASATYVENLDTLVGQEFLVKIIDFDKESNKVVLSRKVIEAEERAAKKKEILQSIKKDDKLSGRVTKLMNFGAFVDLGGVEGLIHNNDLAWKRVKHPSEVVKEGDQVEVYVINVDKERERISLGLKDISDSPWSNVDAKYHVGQVYDGKVTRLADFGAFVSLEDNFEGLVHISQIANKRIDKPSDILKVGDTVKVKIMNIDEKENRLKLSIRDAIEDAERVDVKMYNSDEEATTNLQDVFKVFLKDIKK